MAKKKKEKKAKESTSKDKGTLLSICFGMGALVFAFFLIFSPSDAVKGVSNGASVLQQLTGGGANGGQNQSGEMFRGSQGLAPEGRLDGTFPQSAFGTGGFPQSSAPGAAGASKGGGTSQNEIDAYLNGAWSSPPAQQQPMMQPNMMQRGGFGQIGRFQGGGFGGQQGFNGNPGFGFAGQPAMNQPPGSKKSLLQQLMGKNESFDASSRISSVRGAVQNELSLARAKASAASSCMQRATNTSDPALKQSAASEARSYANQARAAAERAASRGAGVADVQGLISEARAFSNRAESSALYAEQAAAASGW